MSQSDRPNGHTKTPVSDRGLRFIVCGVEAADTRLEAGTGGRKLATILSSSGREPNVIVVRLCHKARTHLTDRKRGLLMKLDDASSKRLVTRSRLSLPLVAIMVLAACSGSAQVSDSTGSEPGVSGESPNSTEAVAAEGETLSEFFGYDDDPEAAEAEFRQQESEIQELVRACMTEQGFEYTPVVQPAGAFSFGPQDQETFVKEYGFGISTYYGAVDDPVTATTGFVDPNQETVNAMSESEQTAYYEALYGSEDDQTGSTIIDEETGEEVVMMTGYGAGCQGEASTEVYGDPSESEELYTQVEPIYQELGERVEADPRVVEANQSWSSCMTDVGYEYDNRLAFQETVYQELQTRFDEIVGPNGGFVDPFEGMTEEEITAFFEETTPEEQEAFFAQAEQQTGANVDQEAVAALQEEEIALAVADYECGKALDEIYQEVSAEIEPEILAENRELFEQLREVQQN